MKKLIFTIGSITALVAPIATVIACGEPTITKDNNLIDPNKIVFDAGNVPTTIKIVNDLSNERIRPLDKSEMNNLTLKFKSKYIDYTFRDFKKLNKNKK